MLLKQLFDQDTWSYTYLLADLESGEAIIIDPVVGQVERDLRLIAELGLELVATLDTHVHADHVTGSGELRRQTGALSAVSSRAKVLCADRQLEHGDLIPFGRYALEVRSTPGHTDGCVTFVLETEGQTLAFTGDALLIRGCGRTDFQQGDSATLYRSVKAQILSLPADTLIYPAHDYRGHSVSSVAEELAHNPRLKEGVSEEAFVTMMNELELPFPRRIHEALSANIGCGLLEPERPEVSPIKELDASSPWARPRGIVVDVRTPEEFESDLGHLSGAILVPLSELKREAKGWSREVPLTLVCRTGRRSYLACRQLTEMGFSDVTNLVGGMRAWRTQQEGRAS